MLNFVEAVNSYGRTMPKGAPPIDVIHPNYGALGGVYHKGFTPRRGRWASTRAILRDSDRKTVKDMRRLEDCAPKAIMAGVLAMLAKDPLSMAAILGAISNYDAIVSARGNGLGQDLWMTIPSFTPVTTSWYDTWQMARQPGSVPSVTAYTNAGTGGAVLTSASQSNILTDPGGTNKKYIVSVGLTVTAINGFVLAMLVDNLWAGSYVITSNVTINPTTDVAVTRWTGTASAGNMMMTTLASTLTHTAAATLTTTYTDQGGTTGRTSISINPATGPLVNRIIHNTLHNSATLCATTPFMPLTNGGCSGVRSLEQVVISGGTVSAGTLHHKIVRPLVIMPFIAANSYVEQDTTLNIGNMVELVNASQVIGCIDWLVFSNGTTASGFSAMIRTAEG